MTLPFFYIPGFDTGQKDIILDEDTSRHVVQVLRMKTGDELNLTDGKGNLLACSITDENKKQCSVRVKTTSFQSPPARKISIAISLLKNANRFEWFLEKATEIGVQEIIPLVCERTEKEKFRFDRLKGICVSAMLQSQQTWLPVLHEPVQFEDLMMRSFDGCKKYIAHCIENEKKDLGHEQAGILSDKLVCIGPEGDFTVNETELALQKGFIPVSLGQTRLRAETAGIVAAVMLVNLQPGG
jgi:16S rRNA (uracil1498-N3)-methyltransferase